MPPARQSILKHRPRVPSAETGAPEGSGEFPFDIEDDDGTPIDQENARGYRDALLGDFRGPYWNRDHPRHRLAVEDAILLTSALTRDPGPLRDGVVRPQHRREIEHAITDMEGPYWDPLHPGHRPAVEAVADRFKAADEIDRRATTTRDPVEPGRDGNETAADRESSREEPVREARRQDLDGAQDGAERPAEQVDDRHAGVPAAEFEAPAERRTGDREQTIEASPDSSPRREELRPQPDEGEQAARAKQPRSGSTLSAQAPQAQPSPSQRSTPTWQRSLYERWQSEPRFREQGTKWLRDHGMSADEVRRLALRERLLAYGLAARHAGKLVTGEDWRPTAEGLERYLTGDGSLMIVDETWLRRDPAIEAGTRRIAAEKVQALVQSRLPTADGRSFSRMADGETMTIAIPLPSWADLEAAAGSRYDAHGAFQKLRDTCISFQGKAVKPAQLLLIGKFDLLAGGTLTASRRGHQIEVTGNLRVRLFDVFDFESNSTQKFGLGAVGINVETVPETDLFDLASMGFATPFPVRSEWTVTVSRIVPIPGPW